VTANQVSVFVADGVGGFFEVSAVWMSFHGLNRPHRSLDSERNRPYLGPTDIGTSALAVSAATWESTEGRCVDDPEDSALTP
jgi:hypothetical protein